MVTATPSKTHPESLINLCTMLVLLALPFKVHAQDSNEFGFLSLNSVDGTLKATKKRQREGDQGDYLAWKEQLADETGLSFGFDDLVLLMDTNSDRSPSDAAGNVFRLYGTWTVIGRTTANNGALVYKIENRSAIGDRTSPQALGPSLGYAGLFASTYSDAGWVLTNLYWRQRFANGRGSFVVGQVDVTDYVDVNNLADPWTAFTNLAFEQLPTLPAPSQGLGAAVLWRVNYQWAVLGGVANANGDASDPVESAQKLFDSGETFKHFAIGWSPDWNNRYDQLLQLTFWQVDEREEAGVEGGHGVSFAASARINQWRPFLRAGYAKDGGTLLERAVSIGVGYDARGGKDLVGLGVGWGRAPDNSRDQYSLEAFYRYDATDFLQLTPSIQYVANPAYDPETGDLLVFGVRLRVFF